MSKLTDYQRGWADGVRSLIQLVTDNMKPTRPGTVPRIDMHRFDSLVERWLGRVSFPADPQAEQAVALRDSHADERGVIGSTSGPDCGSGAVAGQEGAVMGPS